VMPLSQPGSRALRGMWARPPGQQHAGLSAALTFLAAAWLAGASHAGTSRPERQGQSRFLILWRAQASMQSLADAPPRSPHGAPAPGAGQLGTIAEPGESPFRLPPPLAPPAGARDLLRAAFACGPPPAPPPAAEGSAAGCAAGGGAAAAVEESQGPPSAQVAAWLAAPDVLPGAPADPVPTPGAAEGAGEPTAALAAAPAAAPPGALVRLAAARLAAATCAQHRSIPAPALPAEQQQPWRAVAAC